MALPIIVKWGGQEYSVTTLSEDDTVLDLKQFLRTLTGVLPERQKLLGLKIKGKPAENDVKLGALKLKPNTKIMMMGTREESLEDVLGPPPDNDDVVNDFDIEDEVVEVENREENLLKISRRSFFPTPHPHTKWTKMYTQQCHFVTLETSYVLCSCFILLVSD
ncbi:ubiquitin like domain containing CTD phosphatase 1 [Phyllostomus discolor]|uniref:Ubiquitin like domain containing CTD phosphatase 1 n=1 Tax=Phyllostomus discolor TaxID=89673 RepID=A0A833Z3E3_9CHIR|nr:ubiquitin like domain containing CTD phosphatase 1 [Phyllostomus discolor]